MIQTSLPGIEVDEERCKAGGTRRRGNPCIRVFGLGPAGARCKDCRRLYYRHYSRRYYKCELREDTRGPGSDHRVNWPACGRFETAVRTDSTP